MPNTDKPAVTQEQADAHTDKMLARQMVAWGNAMNGREAEGVIAAGIRKRRIASVEAATREKDAEIERWISAYNIAHDQALENGHALARLRAKLDEAIAHYDIEPENWMLAVEAVEILRAALAGGGDE